MAHSRALAVLASFSGKTVNASAVARRLLVSHTTAAEWIRDLERLNQLWLLPPRGARRRPLLLVRAIDSIESRLVEALWSVSSVEQIHWWRSGVRPIVWIADLATERVGVCIAASIVARRADWLPLILARRRGLIDRGLLLHADAGATIREGGVVALPSGVFLEAPEAWIVRTANENTRRAAVWQFNRERLARWRAHR